MSWVGNERTFTMVRVLGELADGPGRGCMCLLRCSRFDLSVAALVRNRARTLVEMLSRSRGRSTMRHPLAGFCFECLVLGLRAAAVQISSVASSGVFERADWTAWRGRVPGFSIPLRLFHYAVFFLAGIGVGAYAIGARLARCHLCGSWRGILGTLDAADEASAFKLNMKTIKRDVQSS